MGAAIQYNEDGTNTQNDGEEGDSYSGRSIPVIASPATYLADDAYQRGVRRLWVAGIPLVIWGGILGVVVLMLWCVNR